MTAMFLSLMHILAYAGCGFISYISSFHRDSRIMLLLLGNVTLNIHDTHFELIDFANRKYQFHWGSVQPDDPSSVCSTRPIQGRMTGFCCRGYHDNDSVTGEKHYNGGLQLASRKLSTLTCGDFWNGNSALHITFR